MRKFALTFLFLAAWPAAVSAAETHVAVAANFTGAAKEIAEVFRAKTGHTAVLSFGSTGQFYAQIKQGAPFEVFLSADDERPVKLAAEGLGESASRFTYAFGALVLWSRSGDLVKGEATLREGRFNKIAFANPVAAPYGAAAVEVLKALNLHDTLKAKFVEGSNISQTYQFVETGNAELGFVALAQLAGNEAGSRWLVPQSLYTPIRQDAILLKKGADNVAAKALMDFLKGPEARRIILNAGYTLD